MDMEQASQSTTIDKQLYEVWVAGLPLILRSSHDEQTVKELAALVDEKIKEALGRGKNISFQNALLLAALHLAEDLTTMKRHADQRLSSLENKAQDILSSLEASPISRIRLGN